jgi:preprotein translocase subunit Sec63
VDRNNEVLRIIGAFRLNGFEQLGLPFDATPEDIRKAYRKLSLLVHPDKCSHPQAKAAFEIVNAASKQLQDDDRRRELVHVLNLSRGEQSSSPMNALRLAYYVIGVRTDRVPAVSCCGYSSPMTFILRQC